MNLKTIKKKDFQIKWATWTLFLGITLFVGYVFKNVHSLEAFFQAFITLHMPASWCPTFLTMYGLATILSYKLRKKKSRKIAQNVAYFAGLVLLPIGLYALYTFSLEQPFSFRIMEYVYPQVVHFTEIVTGLFTAYVLLKK
jgi:hypothetical protein